MMCAQPDAFYENVLNTPTRSKKGVSLGGIGAGNFMYNLDSRSWLDEKAAYWFSTPEAWRIDDPTPYRALKYQRARAAWELLREVEGR